MKPVAFFNYNVSGLTVQFYDQSLNNPATWAWDFGDGETSTDQNPLHTFAARGFFTVKLVSSDDSDPVLDSDPFEIQIGVAESGDIAPFNIFQLIRYYVPSTVTIDNNVLVHLLRKWQLYLSTLVEHDIQAGEIYNEHSWTALENYLIAALVAYDLIVDGANAYLLSIGAGALSEGTTSTSSSSEVKKIVTGPAEVEFSSLSETWQRILKPEGMMEGLKLNACSLAKRLRVFIPMCGQLSHSPVVPQKHQKPVVTFVVSSQTTLP